MHTEEQARRTWCPHVRLVSAVNSPGNRWLYPKDDHEIIPDTCMCIASSCSQWRSGGEPSFFEYQDAWHVPFGEGWRLYREHTHDTIPVWRREMRDHVRLGYCGLAGKPEA